jgi:hypothetical protein
MNTRTRRITYTVAFACLAGSAIGFTAALSDETPVRIGDLPPAVRATIKAHAKGGTIEGIERTTLDGRTVYEVDVEMAGGDVEFLVGADGAFLGDPGQVDDEAGAADGDGEHADADGDEVVETEIPFAEAPQVVRDAFAGLFKNAKATRTEHIVDEAVTKYEIEFAQDGGTASATFSDRGEIMEIEHPANMKTFPEAIRREIEKDHPGAVIKSADAVQLFYYELTVVVDGKTIEVIAFASGDIEDHVAGGESGDEGDEHADADADHDQKGGGDDDDDDDDDHDGR